jgi:hypothetical protein
MQNVDRAVWAFKPLRVPLLCARVAACSQRARGACNAEDEDANKPEEEEAKGRGTVRYRHQLCAQPHPSPSCVPGGYPMAPGARRASCIEGDGVSHTHTQTSARGGEEPKHGNKAVEANKANGIPPPPWPARSPPRPQLCVPPPPAVCATPPPTQLCREDIQWRPAPGVHGPEPQG